MILTTLEKVGWTFQLHRLNAVRRCIDLVEYTSLNLVKNFYLILGIVERWTASCVVALMPQAHWCQQQERNGPRLHEKNGRLEDTLYLCVVSWYSPTGRPWPVLCRACAWQCLASFQASHNSQEKCEIGSQVEYFSNKSMDECGIHVHDLFDVARFLNLWDQRARSWSATYTVTSVAEQTQFPNALLSFVNLRYLLKFNLRCNSRLADWCSFVCCIHEQHRWQAVEQRSQSSLLQGQLQF